MTTNSLSEVVMERIFVALPNGKLDSGVLPKYFESVEAGNRHRIFRSDLWICRNDFHESLPQVSSCLPAYLN